MTSFGVSQRKKSINISLRLQNPCHKKRKDYSQLERQELLLRNIIWRQKLEIRDIRKRNPNFQLLFRDFSDRHRRSPLPFIINKFAMQDVFSITTHYSMNLSLRACTCKLMGMFQSSGILPSTVLNIPYFQLYLRG